ncbi:MAG: SMP-30/gluconolactonase/LRE family protein [Pseudomonadota bacterium]
MIDVGELGTLGAGLVRPECVVCHVSGLAIVPDWTPPGGVTLLTPDGSVTRLLATAPDVDVPTPLRPNGVALEDGGTLLLAHLGDDRGGVYRLHGDGRCEAVVTEIAATPLPPTNFVMVDADGRLWITVSTRAIPRSDDFHPDAAGGLIAVHERGETRIVADGLGYANECVLSPDGATLYVNETFGRRLSAFDLRDGMLCERRTVTTFGAGVFPDGVALAADGTAVVTSILSNRVIQVNLETGGQTLWLADSDEAYLSEIEEAFQSRTLARAHLATPPPGPLSHVSSLAFAGADLSTAYLGTLGGDRLYHFTAPVAGLATPHWTRDLGPLSALAGLST